jgi:hypothetical protein
MLENSEKSKTQFRKNPRHNSEKFRDTNPVIFDKTGNRRKRSVKHHADSDIDSDRKFQKPIRFRKIPLLVNLIEKIRNRFPEYQKILKPFSSLAAGHCCAQLLWMRQTLRDYGYKLSKVSLLCDNESAIALDEANTAALST